MGRWIVNMNGIMNSKIVDIQSTTLCANFAQNMRKYGFSLTHILYDPVVRVNTHMKFMKIIYISRPPTPLSIYVQSFATSLTLGV